MLAGSMIAGLRGDANLQPWYWEARGHLGTNWMGVSPAGKEARHDFLAPTGVFAQLFLENFSHEIQLDHTTERIGKPSILRRGSSSPAAVLAWISAPLANSQFTCTQPFPVSLVTSIPLRMNYMALEEGLVNWYQQIEIISSNKHICVFCTCDLFILLDIPWQSMEFSKASF